MPIHETKFPVRYDECDPYGHVNHAHYARYMSVAAHGASDLVGYSDQKLKEMGAVWLVREHTIEFIQPYQFGDIVHIETWVSDFRRVRSLRQYIFWKNGNIAARASTDWVFANRAAGQPRRVPDQMKDDFIRSNGPDDRPPVKRTPFPDSSPGTADTLAAVVPVEWRDVDPNGHVNNAAFFSYIENGTWALCARYGWPPQRMVERGFGIVARRYRMRYLAPAVMGDNLQINTWVSNPRRATAIRHYEIRRSSDRTLLVRANAFWVWVDLQTGGPIRIPQDFWADFARNVSDE